MPMTIRFRHDPLVRAALIAISLACPPESRAQAAASKPIADIDLAKAFGTRSAWRFVASQDPQPSDPSLALDYAAATVHVCLTKSGSAACSPSLEATPAASHWGAQQLNV